MVSRYPHLAVYAPPKEAEPTDPVSADGWVEGLAQEEEVEVPCRLSVSYSSGSGGAKTITSEDGTSFGYSFNLYMGKDAPKMPEGADIVVYSDGEKLEQIGKGTVKRFLRGSFNATAWV